MYNNKFIDLMDKINVTAKSMNFTNGISWARNAFENKKLNQLEYNDYKKCLFLRNLIAHRSANPCKGAGTCPKPQYSPKRTPIRVDDYVIMMHKGEYDWGKFSRQPDPDAAEQRKIQLGFVGQVTDPKLNNFYLLTHGYDTEYKTWVNSSDALYVFRTDMIMDYGLTPYIIDKPVEFEKDGKPYLTIRYVQYDEEAWWPVEVIEHTCEGYKVGKKTFDWLNNVYDIEGLHPL